MADTAQIAARTTAVVEGERFAIIHVMSAPPTAMPARLPAVCHPDAAPRLASGTVSAIIASTAEPLVATAACATKSAAVYTQSRGTGPRDSVRLGGMSAVAASPRAVTAMEAKNHDRRRGPASRTGVQKSLTTWGRLATCVTVAMSVIGSPSARRTSGTAMVAKPTASPNGSVSTPQNGARKLRGVMASGTLVCTRNRV